MLNPVLRYQTGDAGQFVECACGRGMGMKILGRRDSVVQVRGLGLHVDDIIAQVEREPGVSRAQVLITELRGRVSTVDVLLLTDQNATPDLAERLRKELQGSTFTISTAFQHDPDSFQVKVVDSLISNDRTGKTSNFVVRDQS
jgi:phenylacetate-CoA ligase